MKGGKVGGMDGQAVICVGFEVNQFGGERKKLRDTSFTDTPIPYLLEEREGPFILQLSAFYPLRVVPGEGSKVYYNMAFQFENLI